MNGLREDLDAVAPTMGRLGKLRYTHLDMIDFIILHPEVSQEALGARYGFSGAWVSNVMASDAWKSQMAKRRSELVDPALLDGIAERFKGLARLSLERLQEKLQAPQVSDGLVLKAVELGARGLEIGGFGRPTVQAPAVAVPEDRLSRLASRLEALQGVHNGEIIDGEIVKE